MLRRLKAFLRRGLFVVGVGVLVWLAISYVLAVTVVFPLPSSSGGVLTGDRGGVVMTLDIDGTDSGSGVMKPSLHHSLVSEVRQLGIKPPDLFSVDATEGYLTVSLSLYLLAAACLAWPVTSFLLHRRHQRRGFAVQPDDDSGMTGA